MSAPKGYSTQEKDDRLSAQFQTIEPVRELQYGSTVVSHQFVYEVGTDAAEAGSTAYSIVASAHAALKGDVILLTSGALSGREVKVWDVSTNLITLGETLPSVIATGVTFKILRHKYPSVDSDGLINVNATIVEAALSPDGGALPADLKVVGGYDGSAVQVIKTDSDGELQIDVLSSALPTGAATEATLSTLATEASLAGLNSVVATEATLNSINTLVGSLANCVDVAEIQVDVVSSALPTGAATEATLQGVATEATVSTLATEATVSTLGTETTLSAVKTAVETIDNAISGNEMQVDVKLIEGVIDANNTTSTPLIAGGNFTGAWTEVKDYNSINLGVFSDVGSATDGLRVEYSFDGVSVHHFHLWTFPGGANGIGYQLAAEFRYFRINYTNGASPQTTFLIQSNLKPTALFPSSYRASQTFSSQSQVILTKGIIVGETTGGGGGYVSVKVNPSGALTVDATVTSSALPTGAATEAKQDSGIALLTTIDADTGALAGCVSGNEVQVDVISSALPTGAATEATLASIESDTSSLAGCVAGNEVQVDIVAALPSGTNNIGDVDVASIVAATGRSAVTRARHVYSSTPVTTATYQQLVASLPSAVNEIEIFDSSGETLVIATGAISSEVDQVYVFPGGNGRIPLAIASGARVSVKAVSATASAGEIAINFYS